MTRLYLSGPMRGIPAYNFPAFAEMAALLRKNDYDVISPAEHDLEVDPNFESHPEFAEGGDIDVSALLGWDLAQIADPLCDGIVLMAGWENSTGAKHELHVAEALGKKAYEVQYTDEGRPWGTRALRATSEPYEDWVDRVNTPSSPPIGIRTFDTGANRNADTGKPDYDGFLSVPVLRRYGAYMHEHRHLEDGTLRDADNWQKGIPVDVYRKSMLRHVFDVWELGRQTPDNTEVMGAVVDSAGSLVDMESALCAVIFNAMGLLHETLKGNA